MEEDRRLVFVIQLLLHSIGFVWFVLFLTGSEGEGSNEETRCEEDF